MAKALTLASVSLVLGAFALAQWQRQIPQSESSFAQIRPDLYRLTLWVDKYVVAPMPVAVWLIETSPKSWILIDGGMPDAQSQQAVLIGLQSMLSSTEDILRLVLVTHAHSDHTGVFSTLLNTYPKAKFAFHEDEQPFLSGGTGSYKTLPADNLKYRVLAQLTPKINSTMIPSSKALLLKGSSGDVSDLFTNAKWLPKGLLEYHAVPGHAPGQTAFYHKPTGSVIAADSIVQMPARWSLSGTNGISLGDPVVSYNEELTRRSQQRLAVLPGVHTFFPSHDAKSGVSTQALQEFIKAQ